MAEIVGILMIVIIVKDKIVKNVELEVNNVANHFSMINSPLAFWASVIGVKRPDEAGVHPLRVFTSMDDPNFGGTKLFVVTRCTEDVIAICKQTRSVLDRFQDCC